MSLFHFEEKRIVKQWDEIMEAAKIQNKEEIKKTFLVYSIKKEEWGYNLMVTIPNGCTFEQLEKLKPILEVAYPCSVEMGRNKLSDLANVKLITKDFSDKKYEPIELEPYEIFLGWNLYGKAITVSLNKFPHVLIAGSTGSGKSRLAFIILTNLIYNNKTELYLTQIRKKDLSKFKDHAKGYAFDEFEAAEMFIKLTKEIDRRINLIDKADCENIEEYNVKHNLPYIVIFGDEFSFYMEDKTDDENLKMAKSICLSKIKEIIKTGRSVGVFLILMVQKTTADELLPLIKSQMRCKIAFSMTSKNNSQNIIESDEAFALPQREFILLTDKIQHCKTPYIDKEMVKRYIGVAKIEKPHSKPINDNKLQINHVHKIDIPRKYDSFCTNITRKEEPPKKKKEKGVLKNVNTKG